jgi:crotonobetainyl-CoA:carnitine CoA-transferase CaiB-like acyl-CoA transferase
MRPRREVAANALSNHYRTKDGRWFIMTAANELKEWTRFPTAVGHPELAEDPRFVTQQDRQKNAGVLISILDEIFAQQDMAYWRKAFRASQITVGEVAKTEDIRDGEQVRAAGITVPATDPGLGADVIIDSPMWIDGEAKVAPGPAPDVGQHNLEILAEAGYDEAGIAELRVRGAFGGEI